MAFEGVQRAAAELLAAHPMTDPITASFKDLRVWLTGLPDQRDFDDEGPDRLEAIQLAWIRLREQREG